MSRLTINSNIPSLNAKRNLGNATKSLETSFTRLSSGLRINKASDDAAGLSISESLKADTRIFNQGIRNLNDGLSLLSVADGALNELTNIVTRLSELAEQSANGTLGNKQRLSLDQEAQSLSKEYNRIARSTEFNGRKIFNGDFGDLSLAAGGGRESMITSGLGGAIGDGSFKARLSVATDSGPYSVNTADFNSDGIIDIITANTYASDNINILIGNSDGSFNRRVSYAAGNDPGSFSLADFNQDGILDIATTDLTSSNISILIGNSNGTFKARQSYLAVSGPSNLTVSDFNNDGFNDLVVGNSGTARFSIYSGNGDGSFKSAVTFYSHSPTAFAVNDFNNDGNIDIVNTNYAVGTFSISFGNGNGSFNRSVTYQTGSFPNSIIAEDINDDQVSDIIVADYIGNSISVYIGNSNGTFNARTSYVGITPTEIKLSDFNGDGIKDIVSANTTDWTISVYLGNKNGSFNSSQKYATGLTTSAVSVSDLNRDGVVDIISTDGDSSSISIFIGNSNQGVSALQSFSLKTQQDSRDSITYLRQTLNRLSNQRGEIGAFQSRVETGVSNLQQSSLAYSEANSRITDIDVAEESSKLAANQILQQAAASVLAQANLQPRLVLKLLQDI